MYSELVRHVLVPTALRLRGRRYLSLARRMRRNQYRPRDVVETEQLQRLRALLRHAREHVAYYRERLDEAGLRLEAVRSPGDLDSVPVLAKEDLLANFPDRMTARGARDSRWHYVGTRGTTDRVMVVHDEARRDVEWAAGLVVLSEDTEYDLGKPLVLVPPDECSRLCGIEEKPKTSVWRELSSLYRERRWFDAASRSPLHRFVMENWLRRATLLPPFGAEGTHLPESKLALYAKHLREKRPTLLKALPEYLVAIARHGARNQGALPAIPLVKPMGSKLCSTLVAEIEAAFRGRVREDYGSQEMGAMAFDCSRRSGLHVLEDCFLIEVTRGGENVPDGELGVVLVTDLCNRATPLIRYRIGDVGRFVEGACACGRTAKRLSIEGRVEDSLVLDDGRVLTAEALGNVFYRQPALEDFQIVEEGGGGWELGYVARGGARVDETALVSAFRDLGISGPLRLREQRTILPESSGKFRHSKSRSHARLDEAPLLAAASGSTPGR